MGRKRVKSRIEYLEYLRAYRQSHYHSNKECRAKSQESAYICHDRNRGFDTSNNVNADFIANEYSKGCVYCGETDWHNLGLDRIDNSKPHTKDNVVCCCGRCNTIRSDRLTHKEMKIVGEAIRILREKTSRSQIKPL